ncbi:hypothetical protein C5E45_21835 [Nocardia nova]|uniref:PPM-type phosphatase domain-containing protein n=1 Tax=Nocardia nova TaxID=37330 RepID=A0A2S6ALF1_9NOCA|nr:hypothetical protein C5E45_21835 [Nocardia nova]
MRGAEEKVGPAPAWYDLFPLTPDTWGFFLGDVCGKGADAAVVTSSARYTMRAAAVYDPDPLAVLAHLYTVLCREFHTGTPRFRTVVYGSARPAPTGPTLTVAAGGHPPPVLIRAEGTTESLETPGGMLVGALPDAVFAGRAVHLAPGDTVLLYSDGLTEARVRGRERLGEERLREFIDALGPVSAPGLIAALTELLAGFDGVDDDTALLALGIPPTAATYR